MRSLCVQDKKDQRERLDAACNHACATCSPPLSDAITCSTVRVTRSETRTPTPTLSRTRTLNAHSTGPSGHRHGDTDRPAGHPAHSHAPRAPRRQTRHARPPSGTARNRKHATRHDQRRQWQGCARHAHGGGMLAVGADARRVQNPRRLRRQHPAPPPWQPSSLERRRRLRGRRTLQGPIV